MTDIDIDGEDRHNSHYYAGDEKQSARQRAFCANCIQFDYHSQDKSGFDKENDWFARPASQQGGRGTPKLPQGCASAVACVGAVEEVVDAVVPVPEQQ